MATPAFRSAGATAESASSTTLTVSYTLTAGDYLMVVFNPGYTSVATVNNVKWNGTETMTEIGKYTAGSSFRTCHVYGLVGGTSGTHDVVITMNQTCNVILGRALAYQDVNTSTPFDGVTTSGSTSGSSPTVTVTSETGDLAVAMILSDETFTSLTMTNGTKRSEATSTNGGHFCCDRAGQASTQINGTFGAACAYGMVGFNLNASAAALSGGTTTNSARGLTTATVATTASGGTAPYTYQWERKTFGGSFSNVSGATSSSLNDTGLTAGTRYVYRCKVTDNVSATAYSTEKDVRTWTPVTDSNFYFSPYNWYSDGSGTLQANNILPSSTYALAVNCGAYMKFKVTVGTGGNVVLKVDTSGYNYSGATASKLPRLYYSRDGGSFTSELLAYSASTVDVTLASGLGAGTYEFLVVFNTIDFSLDANGARWSSPNLVVKVNGIDIDYDGSHPSLTLRTNKMLVFGDSLEEGVGTLASGTVPASNDVTQSYGWLMAHAMDAEVGIVAFGGQGYARGINNQAASSTWASFYNSTDANEAWNKYYSGASRLVSGAFAPVPDFVFVMHGHNDTSLAASTVTSVLDEIRTAAGNSCWIFACSNAAGTNSNASAIQTGAASVANTARTKYLAPTQLFSAGAAAGKYNFDTSAHINVRGVAVSAAEFVNKAKAFIAASRIVSNPGLGGGFI